MANDPRHFRIKFSRSYSIEWCDNKFFDKLRELVKNSGRNRTERIWKFINFSSLSVLINSFQEIKNFIGRDSKQIKNGALCFYIKYYYERSLNNRIFINNKLRKIYWLAIAKTICPRLNCPSLCLKYARATKVSLSFSAEQNFFEWLEIRLAVPNRVSKACRPPFGRRIFIFLSQAVRSIARSKDTINFIN